MNPSAKRFAIKAVLLAMVLAVIFYFASQAQDSEAIRQIVGEYGYVGIFVVAIISGFNIVVPIPAVAFVPLFLEVGFDFWITMVVITVGMTLADSIAYLIGGVGRDVIMKNEKYTHERSLFLKLSKLKERHPIAPFIALAIYVLIAPAPNEVILIPMGILGYRLYKIFPIVLVGNFIFSIIYAFGVEQLFQFFT